ncbi:electron-transferring flavoprotein subunit beta, mitochondrial [Pelomyxa schiedti]|nr:electron-transferring flavoprotein subunit beta, mitochondrial [Pelomyxa schiedti]
MGVDRAILVEGLGESPEPLWVAKVLHKIMTRERISLAMLGRSASDTDDSQTGPMLAALANWPQATFASKIEWTFPENKASSAGTPGQTPGSTQGDPPSRVQIKVSRPVEDGKVETMILSLPAVITCDLRLNQPRTVRLQDVMKSQHKKLETINASSLLGIPPGTITQHTRTLCISDPPSRRLSPVTVSSVSELITKLKADGILP